MKKLVKWLEKRFEHRMFVIVDDHRSKEQKPYLIRTILFKSNWCNIFIHRFMKSDKPTPHDHPWNFWSYIVEGQYVEERLVQYEPYHVSRVQVRRTGSLAYRKYTDVHRVILHSGMSEDKGKEYTLEEKDQAPLSIVVTGRRKQEWGFYPQKGDRVDWMEFLEIDPKDARFEGQE